MTQVKVIPITPTESLVNTPKLFVLLTAAVRDQVAEGVRLMSIYPPQLGRSKYRRTGTLRRSWSFGVTTGGGRIEGLVRSASNIAPYNREVQGEEQLLFFGRRGWANIKELDKQINRDFPKRMQDMINRAV